MPQENRGSNIGLYDEAVARKLRCYLPDEKVIYCAPEEALSEKIKAQTDEEKEQGTYLPFVSIWRVKEELDLQEGYSEGLFRRGRTVEVKDGTAIKLRSLPERLTYQFDLWAGSREVVDEMRRELIFCLADDPDITLTLPEKNEKFTLIFEDEEDNTDITAWAEEQKLYRRTLRYFTRAQIFMRRDYKAPKGIDIVVKIEKKNIDGGK